MDAARIESAASMARAYTDAGWSLCAIKPQSKAPYGSRWQEFSRDVSHWEQFPGDGIGLIHGLSGTCSLDLDDLESAHTALAAVGVDLAALLADPESVRVIGKPGRGKLLYRSSPELARVALRWPDAKTRKDHTVLELRAGNVQDVLPPSIHPDTGEPYRWDGDWRTLPELPEELLAVWQHWDIARLDMEAACPWGEARTVSQPQRAPIASTQVINESVIAAFNEVHPDPSPFLERNGYRRAGNRWTAPTSESGLPGVVALLGADGRTRVYSHHGSDPLNTGKALDSFDLFTHFEHGGDVGRAVRAAAEMLGMAYRAEEIRLGANIAAGLLRPTDEHEVAEDELGEVIQEGEAEGDAIPDQSHDALALKWGKRLRRNARYVSAWGCWYFYVRHTWHADEQLLHMTLMRRFLRGEAQRVEAWAARKLAAAVESGDTIEVQRAEKVVQWAEGKGLALRSAQTVAQVVSLARSNPDQVAVVQQWDADPWALGTPDGVVDLRSGELRRARPDDYITKSCAVAPADPGTPAPLWEDAIEVITDGDEELQGYLQRLFGYFLTGSIREQIFGFAHGTGANGKGLVTNTLKSILGSYAAVIPSEMLMVSQNDRHPTELARLRGIRLALASETEQGKRWAESKIKSLTGGDPVAARFMRADFFEFEPQFKLFVVGNHRPSLRGVDEAMRRRLHFIPFEVTIPPQKRDKDLPEKLRGEWPAILRWAIDGCIEWQHCGLCPPSSVQKATEEYFEDEDAVGLWLAERTLPDANAWESSAALFGSWKDWADEAGEFIGTQKRFAHILEERGFREHRKSGARGFIGARIKPAPTRIPDWRDREAS